MTYFDHTNKARAEQEVWAMPMERKGPRLRPGSPSRPGSLRPPRPKSRRKPSPPPSPRPKPDEGALPGKDEDIEPPD